MQENHLSSRTPLSFWQVPTFTFLLLFTTNLLQRQSTAIPSRGFVLLVRAEMRVLFPEV